jgi:O-phosphoseryl-tRNA(Cys) synthetase
VFYNIDENKDENTTDIIHQIMEHKLSMENAAREVKIDRSPQTGKTEMWSNEAATNCHPFLVF